MVINMLLSPSNWPPKWIIKPKSIHWECAASISKTGCSTLWCLRLTNGICFACGQRRKATPRMQCTRLWGVWGRRWEGFEQPKQLCWVSRDSGENQQKQRDESSTSCNMAMCCQSCLGSGPPRLHQVNGNILCNIIPPATGNLACDDTLNCWTPTGVSSWGGSTIARMNHPWIHGKDWT